MMSIEVGETVTGSAANAGEATNANNATREMRVMVGISIIA